MSDRDHCQQKLNSFRGKFLFKCASCDTGATKPSLVFESWTLLNQLQYILSWTWKLQHHSSLDKDSDESQAGSKLRWCVWQTGFEKVSRGRKGWSTLTQGSHSQFPWQRTSKEENLITHPPSGIWILWNLVLNCLTPVWCNTVSLFITAWLGNNSVFIVIFRHLVNFFQRTCFLICISPLWSIVTNGSLPVCFTVLLVVSPPFGERVSPESWVFALSWVLLLPLPLISWLLSPASFPPPESIWKKLLLLCALFAQHVGMEWGML